MNAVVYTEFGGPDVLHLADVEEPHAGPGQVRIAVRAVGVNPIDYKLRSGMMGGNPGFPAIDGREASGVVDEVGEGAQAQVGDAVFGFSVAGAAAEYAVLQDFAAKPDALSFEQAAGLPVAAETSVRVFTVLGGLHEGGTLLINGAAGGVGAVGVQLARARGQRVLGTASERNFDFLRSLGAEPLLYGAGVRERALALAPGGVDYVFDVAGRGPTDELIALVGDPAKVASIAAWGDAGKGIKLTGGSDFRAIDALPEAAELMREGRLQLPIEATFRFADAAQAHRLSEEGHVRGKLILTPA
jgi:NADPH:quinone reductase-like Zn-dependent oxidoreductase